MTANKEETEPSDVDMSGSDSEDEKPIKVALRKKCRESRLCSQEAGYRGKFSKFVIMCAVMLECPCGSNARKVQSIMTHDGACHYQQVGEEP